MFKFIKGNIKECFWNGGKLILVCQEGGYNHDQDSSSCF